MYVFLAAILVLGGFIGYQYVLSPRVKRAQGKQTGQNLLGTQAKGSYDPDWIPKHHLNQSKEQKNVKKQYFKETFASLFLSGRSPRKSPSQRKTRQNNDANGTNGIGGAASSENDE